MFIKVNDVSKSYGAKRILKNISLTINERDRLGLIGENGSGKTTLCKILLGSEKPDNGSIEKREGIEIGYLPQEVEVFSKEMSVQKYFERALGSLDLIKQEMEVLEKDLKEENLARYGELQDLWERRGGYELEHKVAKVKEGLFITHIGQDRLFTTLSGGEKTRVALAALLIFPPDLLILDEPTNHLDFQTLKWLEDYLSNFKNSLIVISHDREFLNKTITKIAAISVHTHEIEIFHGNYDSYLIEREKLLEKMLKIYEDYVEKIKSLKRELKHQSYSTKGPRLPTDSNIMAYDRKGEKSEKSKSSKIQAIKVELERLEQNPPRKPMESALKGFRFYEVNLPSQKPIKIEDLSKSFSGKVILKNVSKEIFRSDRIIIVGDNGCGKTTFLKLLMGEEKPDRGTITIEPSVKIGYLDQEQKSLCPENRVLEEYSLVKSGDEGELREDLHKLGLFTSEEVFLKVKDLSLGQKQKLMLAKIVALKPNLLIMDEPTNHLDLLSLEELEKALLKFSHAIIAVSHDRRFIKKIATDVWQLKDGKLIANFF